MTLAIGGTARSASLPQIRAFAELGCPKITDTQWHGIAVRAGGKKPVSDRLYKEILHIPSEPANPEELLCTGCSAIDVRPPAALTAFIAAETQTWARVVKTPGVPAER